MSDLILLGIGPSMANCPFDTEVWATLSLLGIKGWENKPYSKLFCFDVPSYYDDHIFATAKERGLTIVSTLHKPYVTETYPIRGVRERFNSTYLRNTMSYMIAMALYQGYKSLSLWGVDQGPEEKYRHGRKYVTYWLGVATGMGVRWELSPNCVLWRTE